MADNPTVDNGGLTDIVVSADDSGATGQVQRVKLTYSADGSATHVPADADGVLVNLGANNDVTVAGVATAANQVTIIGHVDGLEALLTTIAGAIAGSEMQVDVLTAPTLTVNAHAVTNAGTFAVQNTAALVAGTNNIGDVDVLTLPALPAGTNTVGAVSVKPATSGGLTVFHLASAGSTNATVVKASAGQLFGWYIYNSNAAARKVAFHNTASAPTAGASVYFTATIPPGSAANVEYTNGIAFGTGIAITTVTGLADSDNTAVAANDLIINLFYA